MNPQFELKDLPTVASANPDRNVFDSARLIVAKVVSEAWGLDAEKVFVGVDTGELDLWPPRSRLTSRKERF